LKKDGLHVNCFDGFEIKSEVVPVTDSAWEEFQKSFASGDSWPLVKIPVEGVKLSDYVMGRNNWKTIDFDQAAPALRQVE